MYVPAAFRESDVAKLHDFIQSNGFAVLTTMSETGLVASHIPLLLDPTRGPFGTLLGHFAKANDHSSHIDRECLIVFNGPHAYISPTWYEEPNLVPTWNYVAVHAYGILKRIDDSRHLEKVLEQLVTKYEKSHPTPWTFDPNTDVHQKLIHAIVGFEIEITRLEGKWKLNQNHPVERRQRVANTLKSLGDENSQAIARLMEESF